MDKDFRLLLDLFGISELLRCIKDNAFLTKHAPHHGSGKRYLFFRDWTWWLLPRVIVVYFVLGATVSSFQCVEISLLILSAAWVLTFFLGYAQMAAKFLLGVCGGMSEPRGERKVQSDSIPRATYPADSPPPRASLDC